LFFGFSVSGKGTLAVLAAGDSSLPEFLLAEI
jgi:hypothetical protein